MARYSTKNARFKKYSTKAKKYNWKKKYYARKSRKYGNKKKGMQRIKTVRYRAKNIGGDRAYCKLRYVVGNQFGLSSAVSNSQNLAMNLGAAPDGTGSSLLQTCSINGIFGNTPNLSTMAQLYMKYRIRGIKLKLTYWQTAAAGAGAPLLLYTNAQSSNEVLGLSTVSPAPAFVTPTITNIGEQRWSRSRVCNGIATAGGKPTSLTAYYSVNKVFGPDAVVKNDEDFTGEMQVATPYWSNSVPSGTNQNTPIRTPWLQFGITSLDGLPTSATGVLKVEATVYAEFFGKRPLTS